MTSRYVPGVAASLLPVGGLSCRRTAKPQPAGLLAERRGARRAEVTR